MKKKILCVVCVVVMINALLTGCGSDTSASKKEIVTGDESSADETSATEENEETTTSVDVTIEEQVLFETGGVKVTATEYVVDPIWGDGIKLLVENESSSDIGLGCDALIVNDYMITDLFTSSVAAGKKSYETLSLSNSGLKSAGIENVGKVEVYFHTYDPNSYETLEKIDMVTIETSAIDMMDNTPSDSGKELYNDNGIRIVGKYVDEDSFWGTSILLYIENNSGANKIIQCDDMSVNGFMVSPWFSADVYDGKKAIADITLMSSELEEMGIESIDEIELKFKIIDEDFMHSIESDAITFTTN